MLPSSSQNWRNRFLINVNPVIRWLTISDFIIIGSSGLLSPIFAVFITDYLPHSNVQVAGIAITIFLLTKSLAQIPLATIIDRIKGERDDFWILFWGSMVMSLIPIFYIFVQNIAQLYFIQAINGLVTAATFPAYMAIFHRHLDPGKEGTELGVYYTLTDVASAATGAIGGSLAYYIGFKWVFIAVSILSLVGTLALLMIRNRMTNGHWLGRWLIKK
ncbi:MAG TPA: MFS transporter [bacterium]|nr:MFS transporter [bacterium]HNS34342.1 MFS transporter [bacterium]HNZ73537.1 MFS transporter [bacterium]HOH67537.1 MFS transporter [bacterium]HQA63525.1 MFS transporter [bacterium]